MGAYITAIKDILVIAAPIIVAYISYRSNNKTSHDIRLELEKSLKEKDADTTQMLARITAASARVAVPLGTKVVVVRPVMRPFLLAQRMAVKAQS